MAPEMTTRTTAASSQAKGPRTTSSAGVSGRVQLRAALRGQTLAGQQALLCPSDDRLVQRQEAPQASGADAAMTEAAPVDRLDTSSFGHWLQSGMMMVHQERPFLGRALQVDGIVGPNTRRAVRGFQREVPAIVPGAKLKETGRADPKTVGALELATRVDNPTGRPSQSPLIDAAPRDAPEREGQETRAAATDASTTIDPRVATQVQGELAKVAADGPGAAELAAAYRELRASTLLKMHDGSAAKVVALIDTKWAKLVKYHTRKGKPLPDEAAWRERHFFEQYWMLHCNTFASELSALVNPGAPTLKSLYWKAQRLSDKGATDAEGNVQMPGRDLRMRGITLTELTKKLKGGEYELEVGAGIHVKLCPHVDRPYTKKAEGRGNRDDFHHWFTYAGDLKFADSFGARQSGPSCDGFMRRWMLKSFHERGRSSEKFDYRHLHTPEFADPSSLAALAALEAEFEAQCGSLSDAKRKEQEKTFARRAKKEQTPRPGKMVVPQITAIYRPMTAPGKKR